MSVVVWDGKTLAADRRSVCADMISTAQKIWVKHGVDGMTVCACTGGLAEGILLTEWYHNGAIKSAWPKFQDDKDEWCRLIVAKSGKCFFYEKQPVAIEVLDTFMAWGSGRDFAMGALAMGADARKAVVIASKYSTGCGNGVEAFDFK